jgi:hypothetical protein
MALTKISTDGVKDDAVTAGKIPANAVGSSELADNAVDTNAIADQAVALSKLPHGDSNNNGKFLRANNGADPSFETVNTDLVADTTPQLGGHLYANTYNIEMGDSAGFSSGRLSIGASHDLQIYHDGSDSHIEETGTGGLSIKSLPTLGIKSDTVNINNHANSENMARFFANGAVELYYDNSKRFETSNAGGTLTGSLTGTGHVYLPDGGKFVSGANEDLQIYHDGSFNFIRSENGHAINFIKSSTENIAKFIPDGAVELYYDNSKKFETTANGVNIVGGGDLRLPISGNWTGEGTVKIQHHSNKLYVQLPSTGIQLRDLAGNRIFEMDDSGVCLGLDLKFGQKILINGGSAGLKMKSGSDIDGQEFGSWTGEKEAKIQFHSDSIYNQYKSQWVARSNGGSNTFTIDTSGNFSSDERKKENITTVTNALTKVSQLRGVEFKWKEKYGSKEDMGLIAQEVETVLPRLITNSIDPEGAESENEDGTPMKMLNYNGLFSVMVEAIKELKTEVETLKTKVAALEAA